MARVSSNGLVQFQDEGDAAEDGQAATAHVSAVASSDWNAAGMFSIAGSYR